MSREVGRLWEELDEGKEYDQNILHETNKNKTFYKKYSIKISLLRMEVELRKGHLLQISSANFNHTEPILDRATWKILVCCHSVYCAIMVSIANLVGAQNLPSNGRLSENMLCAYSDPMVLSRHG